ncbi:MAG: FKBP-type peptidyl-prolyl cis-trans isomerase [Paludibacteraceae bacterium]|nr:FKBP-type peptidyl-prolyl cis-trans isomerase [Paludibacteraceae bacterium]MBP5137019.1 FKBP-type peptidyl-prolyl cis-trans isomerase [Paludibacteraceae bacterium]MBP5743095.1 FKBP-type peptidyl-prolyl cis-trans isomerase [Paludibacteraceae bacterium]
MEKVSYALGLNIGNNLLGAGIEKLEWEKFLKGVKDSMENNDQEMTNQEAQQELNAFFAKLQSDAEAKNSQQERTFLDNNAKRDEVIVLPSGLQYEVLKSGDGAKPKATDKVRCHYEGTLIDGTVFDSSYKRGEPAVFGVNQVIAGWVEALQLMEVGSKWRLYIPYKLGYGEHGAGNSIPPYSTLIFDVELLDIV